jgi:DNA polymerase I
VLRLDQRPDQPAAEQPSADQAQPVGQAVRRFTTKLGGTPVTVYAPRPGTLDLAQMLKDLPEGQLYGLDVESTYMDEAGPWSPDYVLRTVQVASEHAAYVFRMDDPEQKAAARDVLSGDREFTSHTQIDTVATGVALGVDTSGRNLDTHWLSIMSAPDDTKGGADLKTQATLHGMPELKAADARLTARFLELYRQAHPELGKRAVAVHKLEAWGFANISLDDPIYLGYGGLDAIAVRRLAPKLIKATRAPLHLLRAERWLSEQATKIRVRGHRIDVAMLDKVQEETATEVAEASAIIAEHTGGLKPTQTEKIIAWFGEHGADWDAHDHPRSDPSSRFPNGQPTLAKENIFRLRNYPMDEAGREVTEAYARHAAVLDRLRKTTAIRAGMVKDDQGLFRIHPTLLSIGTVTGRMAATNPNMQNFSKKDPVMRGLFLPEPGCVLLSCDFAQIELRVLAALAGEGSMIGVIKGGGDLHQLTADLLNITRQEAKTVNFLIVYGGGGGKLAAQLKYARSEEECRQIIATYWDQYPAISDLKAELTSLQHEVRLISGRLVPVGRTKDGGSRAYANLNYLIQGSARELLTGAIDRFSKIDPAYAAMLWMMVHDEVILNVPEPMVEQVKIDISAAMTFDFFGVPVEAEADELYDEVGTSRWMPGDHARAIREAMAA